MNFYSFLELMEHGSYQDQSQATFSLTDEDHTLANSLRFTLSQEWGLLQLFLLFNMTLDNSEFCLCTHVPIVILVVEGWFVNHSIHFINEVFELI